MTIYHNPILADTILEFMNIQKTSIIADLTTGEGGHSSLMAPLANKLICLDRDSEILAKAQDRLKDFDNIQFICDTYDHITAMRNIYQLPLFDGILVDMGVSMFHFKGADRGFSFNDDTLDMRLSLDSDLTAQIVINTFSEKDLADIFYYYGEEHHSRKFANVIVKRRPFYSAQELSEHIFQTIGRHGKTHPATKIFQGLRIFVNQELEIAETFLNDIVNHLAPGGIICILTFHSLEDRLVKRAFQQFQKDNLGTLPILKPLVPSFEEIKRNPAARSAKLRVFKRNK
ncbi:MAG: 16S rRNA (cytosine(1402)-N(4))-methyltransferase RsmH [Brevinema sp.]